MSLQSEQKPYDSAAGGNALRDAAAYYVSIGWRVIPIPSRAKSPVLPNWTHLQITQSDVTRYFANGNIGILLGSASNLIDIDLDDPKAVELAPHYLPPTPAIFGRPSKPRSHWIYTTYNPQPTRRLTWSRTDKRVIAEYRSTGAQTVFPPSIHPSGETISWEGQELPAVVDGAALLAAVDALAEAVRATRTGNLTFDATKIRPAEPVSPLDRCISYLEQCPDAVSGAGGHNATFLAACECYRFGLSDGEAWQVIQWFNATKCQPPWSERDLKHKLQSASNKVTSDGEVGRRLTDSITELTEPAPLVNPISATPEIAISVDQAEREPERKETPFPPYLLEPPGFVGELCNWINNTAYKPQPALALANSLAFFGAVVGRKVQTESDLRTNLYCLGVGESGCGKDHSRKQIKRLCRDGALVDLLGGEDVSSDSAILSAVHAHPSILFQFDEIGHLFKSFANRNAAPHVRAIPVVLMKLFSSANTLYIGKEYANRTENPRDDIIQPNVCLYGTTVPEKLFDGLTQDEIRDGFLGRMLVFRSTDPDPEENDTHATAVPERLTDMVTAWYTRETLRNAGGNLERVQNAPMIVPMDEDARRAFAAFRVTCRKQKAAERGGFDVLWSRAQEHAAKVALTVAAGVDYDRPMIDGVIAQYAIQLVNHLVNDLCTIADTNMAGSGYEKDLKAILKTIRERREKGITLSGLYRKFQRLDRKRRDEILLDLEKRSSIIRMQLSSSTNKGLGFVSSEYYCAPQVQGESG